MQFSITTILHLVIRFLQFIFGIVVIGLYAQDLNKARKVGKYSDGKWIFAVVVGSFSTITALIFALVNVLITFAWITFLFAWEWLLFILWAATVGIFGVMYFHENPEMDSGISRMKHAAYIDCVNLVLWFITACWSTVWFFLFRFRGGRAGGGGGGGGRGSGGDSEGKSSYTRRAKRRG